MSSRMIKVLALVSCAGSLVACAAGGTAAPQLAAQNTDASACAGIPADEVAASPLGASARVLNVEPLKVPVTVGKQVYSHLAGAKVTVAAAPGLTKQWLGRVAECEVARHAGPFSGQPVAVSVDEAPTSFVVSLRSTGGDQDAEQLLLASQGLRSAGLREGAVAQNR